MVLDLRIEFHEKSAFIQNMVSGFHLCEKLLRDRVQSSM